MSVKYAPKVIVTDVVEELCEVELSNIDAVDCLPLGIDNLHSIVRAPIFTIGVSVRAKAIEVLVEQRLINKTRNGSIGKLINIEFPFCAVFFLHVMNHCGTRFVCSFL